MATNRWIAAQQYRSEQMTWAVGTNDVSTTYALAIGSYSLTTAGNAGNSSNTASDMYALASGNNAPAVFKTLTWSVSNNVVTAIAQVAGTPFTLTSSVSGGTGTASNATTVANLSPSDANDATNWSNAAVPASGDNVYIDSSSVPLLWNLGAASAVQLASLNIAQSFTGTLGLPETQGSGSSAWEEYRQQYWTIGSNNTTIGVGPGTGSTRIKINHGANQCNVAVYNSGSPDPVVGFAVILKATHANSTMAAQGGSIGTAIFGGDVSTWLTANIVKSAGGATPNVRFGSGCTLGNVTNQGGTVEVDGAVTTLSQKSTGTLKVLGTGAVTTLNVLGGTATYASTGTITNLFVSGGTLDFGKSGPGVTVTNSNFYGGATITDPAGRVTWTNATQLNEIDNNALTWLWGPGRTAKIT